VNDTIRGEHLRRARERRRLSRRELAEILQIDPKTVARIERGQVHRSPNIERLEEYLHDSLTDEPAKTVETAEPTPDIAPADLGPRLGEAHDLELVAELARRLASRREADEPIHPGQTGYFRWYTEDAPIEEPHTPPTSSDRRVADGGGTE
jgi:transcriptional regulator with XRE-family HTH domain